MSVTSLSESLCWEKDLNNRRDEIIEAIRSLENLKMKNLNTSKTHESCDHLWVLNNHKMVSTYEVCNKCSSFRISEFEFPPITK